MPNYNNYPYTNYPMAYAQPVAAANPGANYYTPTMGLSQGTPNYQMGMPVKQNFVWVQGRAGAEAYQAEPGSRTLLIDSNDQRFYIKEVGLDGRPNPLMVFEYKAVDLGIQNGQSGDAPNIDMSNYVTRTDFDELKKMYEETNKLLSKYMTQKE